MTCKYPHPRRLAYKNRAFGLSLVELMVAMTIGLIVMAAVGQIYLASSRTYRTQANLSRIQESARYAMETLSYDIRMAGQVGCSYDASESVNVLNDTSFGDLLAQPVLGIDSGGTIPSPFTAAPTAGDAVRIFRVDENEVVAQSHDDATATFTFSATTPFSKGDILVATDCDTAAVFQVSDPTAASTTVEHMNGTGTPTGNCVANLGKKTVVTGACNTATVKAFPAGSRVSKVLGTLYYIATNPAGEPALYRQRLDKGAPVTEELVEGVEDLQIQYGVDTNADKSVDSTATTAGGVANWDQIQTVQISLLLRSDNNALDQSQTHVFNGTTYGASDRRIRKVFNSTIAVRSRQ